MPQPVPPEAGSPGTHCGRCGTELGPAQRACPGCHALVHADRLYAVSAQAQEAEKTGRIGDALAAWRSCLDLLPPASNQHQQVQREVARLSRQIDQPAPGVSATVLGAATKKKSGLSKTLGALGALGLLLWKFKLLPVFLLSKGKFLLLGLTKASTFLSMFLSLGVYWAAFGWRFAAGLVASIYVHEMGHVASLRHFGLPASAPMFIPGVGAYVRLKQHPATAQEDARIGLAGPMWGLGAALAFLLIGVATGWQAGLAIARVGAWINLFNLLPIWQLDGGRAFRAVSSRQRKWITAVLAALWMAVGDGMLMMLAVVSGVRAWQRGAPLEGDRFTFWQYLAIAAVLTAFLGLEARGI